MQGNLNWQRIRLPLPRTAFYIFVAVAATLMLAAILAASIPVGAQDETSSTPVWQSTFTPVLVSGSTYGCWQHSGNANGHCENVHPGNNFFEWKGQKYYFYNLTLNMSDGLSWMISTNSNGIGTTDWPAELHGNVSVDGVKIPLSNYAYIAASDYTKAGGTTWDAETPVTVIIHRPAPAPTPTPEPTNTPAPAGDDGDTSVWQSTFTAEPSREFPT